MNQDGRFSGDMDRNEVEIDLNKFMAMIQENNDLKQKIFMLEHDDTKNPWQNILDISQALASTSQSETMTESNYASIATYH
jgi:hypothetical protein